MRKASTTFRHGFIPIFRNHVFLHSISPKRKRPAGLSVPARRFLFFIAFQSVTNAVQACRCSSSTGGTAAVGGKRLPPSGGSCRRRRLMRGDTALQCATHPKGFPLWGKLSPKVTDEGNTALRPVSHNTSSERPSGAHLPLKGKALKVRSSSRVKRLPPLEEAFSLWSNDLRACAGGGNGRLLRPAHGDRPEVRQRREL